MNIGMQSTTEIRDLSGTILSCDQFEIGVFINLKTYEIIVTLNVNAGSCFPPV
jgi:hypothetical protein